MRIPFCCSSSYYRQYPTHFLGVKRSYVRYWRFRNWGLQCLARKSRTRRLSYCTLLILLELRQIPKLFRSSEKLVSGSRSAVLFRALCNRSARFLGEKRRNVRYWRIGNWPFQRLPWASSLRRLALRQVLILFELRKIRSFFFSRSWGSNKFR